MTTMIIVKINIIVLRKVRGKKRPRTKSWPQVHADRPNCKIKGKAEK